MTTMLADFLPSLVRIVCIASKRRVTKALAMLVSLLLITGCWDSKEITEVGIITAVAIDKNPDTGEYILSAQYLRPASLSTVSPSPEEPFLIISSTGKTVSELIQEADQNVGRDGFYAHNKVVVVSEEVAKEGLLHLFETFQRDKRVRSYVWLAVAKDTMAKTLLEKKVKSISNVPANFLNSLFISAKFDAVSYNLLNYYKKVLKEGINPVVGVLSFDNEDKEKIRLTGGAVFKEDSLVGFLNDEEAMAFNWVRKESKNKSLGQYKVSMEDGSVVSLRLIDKTSNIVPTIKKGSPATFMVEVNQITQIAEQQKTKEFTGNREIKNYLKKVKESAEKKVEEDITKMIQKTQTDFDSDILGLGDTIHKHYPKAWHKMKKDWQNQYEEINVTVKVNVEIRNAGLIKGSLAPGEQ